MRMKQQEQLYRQEQANREKLEVSRRQTEEAFLVAEKASAAKSTLPVPGLFQICILLVTLVLRCDMMCLCRT